MKKHYILMNKNKEVAYFRSNGISQFSDFSADFSIIEIKNTLPLGFDNINSWIANRKGSKHNKYIKTIMEEIGCESDESYIQLTHGASINDTFWVRSESESVSWEDVSLYCNEFSEMVSKLAFEGVGLCDMNNFPSTSPELSCEGSFRKCFRKEQTTGQFDSDIFIYKRGGELSERKEPYCEALTSEIAHIISPHNSVLYETSILHGKLASRCNLFTDEKYGFVSYAKIRENKYSTLKDAIEYFTSIGSEQEFRELLVIDALCFNTDRHSGNYGVLFDNDTLTPLSLAPVFDFNLSLLPYIRKEDFDNVGDYLYGLTPKLGEDFTRLGQMGMNDKIRNRVKPLKDFTFSFRGDDFFSPTQVEVLEHIIQRQAKALLSHDKLFTKDVFFSTNAYNNEQAHIRANEAEERLNKFENHLNSLIIPDKIFPSVVLGDDNVQYIFEDIDSGLEFNVDFLNNKFYYSFNNKPVPSNDDILLSNKKFTEFCSSIKRLASDYLRRSVKTNWERI